jgi:hypothetical protein
VDEMSFEHGQEAAFCGSLPGMTHMLTVPGFLAEILNFEGGKSGNFEGGKSGNIEASLGLPSTRSPAWPAIPAKPPLYVIGRQ